VYVTRIRSRLRVQIHNFSGKLSPRFSKPLGRFVEQMLYGILVSKDVKLSQIGRALEEPISFKKTEDRLSTNLNGDGLAGILLDQIARLGSRRVQKDALLILGATGGRSPFVRLGLQYSAVPCQRTDAGWLRDYCSEGRSFTMPSCKRQPAGCQQRRQAANEAWQASCQTACQTSCQTAWVASCQTAWVASCQAA
jgi:hypothetical protein